MRKHASLSLHDSADGLTPSNFTRYVSTPARRHGLLAAFVVTATAGSLAGLSAAGASTPSAPAAHRAPAVRHLQSRDAASPHQRAARPLRLAVLLRRPQTPASSPRGAWSTPRSWVDAALHLSLQRLAEQRPPGSRHAATTTLRARLHVGRHKDGPAVEPSDGVAPATWLALRDCESADDYAADTGNGYYGAYQFSVSTWWSIGYAGLPSEAPPAVQDEAAQRLLAVQGWGAWPVCSLRIGM